VSRAAASPVPRVAFRVGEAAEALGVSEDFFSRHIAGELKWIRRGSVKLVSRAELESWLAQSAFRTLDEDEL
jgi:excisionase family DNA binding protein